MFLALDKLQHLNSITHEGKVLVFATDAAGKVWYTVRRDGFEQTQAAGATNNQVAEKPENWEKFEPLDFPNEAVDDLSVVARETEKLTLRDAQGGTLKDAQNNPVFLLRSLYRTQSATAVAPVQLVCGMGHIYVFRQSKAGTLLVDRFVLDGLTNKLRQKLEVRYKRSRKRYEPENPSKEQGRLTFDALNFRDAQNKEFIEPTTELTLVNNLRDGWFSVVLLPTDEHDHFCWHIFAFNTATKKLELTSLAASPEGLFDVQDGRVSGIIRRTLNLNGEVNGAPVATKYDVQQEADTKAGKQLLRTATRVMLAVPTTQGPVAVIDFAAAVDGTLSQVNEQGTRQLLRGEVTDIILPLNTLDEIKAIGETSPAAHGSIAGLTRGEADQLLLQSQPTTGAGPAAESKISIQGTTSLNGLYRAQAIIVGTLATDAAALSNRLSLSDPLTEPLPQGTRLKLNGQGAAALVTTQVEALAGQQFITIEPAAFRAVQGTLITIADAFAVEQAEGSLELGVWQEVKEEEETLIFDGIVTAVTRLLDGKLRIHAFNHGLEDGDGVQLTGMVDYNGVWPIERIDGDNFLLNVKYQPGTAINLRLESRKRRGLTFESTGDTVMLNLALPQTEAAHEFWFRTSAPNGGLFQVVTQSSSGSQTDRRIVLKGGGLTATVGQQEIETGDLGLADGQWHHVAHVFGQSVQGQQLWVDGFLRVTGTQAASPFAGKTTVHVGFRDADKRIPAFTGELAEVRLWNLTRTPQQIQTQMSLPLLGRESGLIGYWRLGAIVEGNPRKVVDFSPFEHDGEVQGDIHASGRTLLATLNDGVTLVTNYANEELVAVSAGATYEESFEFRLKDKNGKAVNPTTTRPRVFNFLWRGKRSRSSDEWIEISDQPDEDGHTAARTLAFESVGNGWFKATGTFTVPEDSGIALIRTFHLQNVQSKLFAELVIRRHHLRLISDSITQENFTDELPLSALGTDSQTIDAALQTIAKNELQEPPLVTEIARLQRLLDGLNNLVETKTQLAVKDAELTRLRQQRATLQSQLDAEIADPRNYKCKIFWREFQGEGRFQDLYLDAVLRPDQQFFTFFLQVVPEDQTFRLWSFIPDERGTGNYRILVDADTPLIFEENQVSLAARFVRREVLTNPDSDKARALTLWNMPNQSSEFSLRPAHASVEVKIVSRTVLVEGIQDVTRHMQWGLKKTDQPGNSRIEDARRVLQTKQAEIDPLQKAVNELRLIVNEGEANRQRWTTERDAAQTKLDALQLAIKTANQTLINASNPPALTMPLVKADSRQLRTNGALLTFTRVASRLNLTETCEGNLQLAYFDPTGRMRLTLYDATADSSRNSTFEQWIQDKARLALNFNDAQAKVILEQVIPLTDAGQNRDDWSIEAWFFRDPTRTQTWSTLVRGAGGDHQIIIKDGQRLGWFQSGSQGFVDCGFELTTLATGWHHIAAVGKGRGEASTTLYYLDGKKVGDLKAYNLSLKQADLNRAKDALDQAVKANAAEAERTRLTTAFEAANNALKQTRQAEMRSRTDVFAIGNFQEGTQPFGKVAEVRIWGVALSDEEVEINSRTTLTGNEPGLLAYYPFNGDTRNHAVGGFFHGTNVGNAAESWGCAAPIGHPEPGAVNQTPVARDAVVSAEYVTYGFDPATGTRTALMRRFLATPTTDGLTLLAQKRIEELDLLWIGNTQFKPTLLGYIEGAPPVPSENLTVDPAAYNGATSVELSVDEEVGYSWNREQTDYRGDSVGGFVGLAWAYEGTVLGFKAFQTEGRVGFRGGQDISTGTINQTNVAASSATSLTDKLELRGQPEDEPKFPHLSRRFIPKNVGYALVVSGLGDVFITRLKRSKRMISYTVQPVDDIPLDVNTITFLINPAYTMNGSLDGLTGSAATSERFFPQVAEMRAQYGALYPASYYRLFDAYDRKAKIEKQDQERAAYFASYKVTDPSPSGFDDLPELQGGKDAKSDAAEQKLDELKAKFDAQQLIHSAVAKAAWQEKMERLLQNAGKRNIVNTYVWDADGGLHAESQQFASVIEHTIGGASEADYERGLDAELLIVAPVGISAELNYMHSQRMSQTLTKTEARSKGFALNVDLSGVEHLGITDYKDRPYLPGEKVDRYRFMSFYLEGDTSHFNDFFNEVVDPEWLASNDEEARALRQVDRSKANKTWRVLHRVTYVERPALLGFGRDVRQLVEQPKSFSELAALAGSVTELKKENKQLREKLDRIITLLTGGSASGIESGT